VRREQEHEQVYLEYKKQAQYAVSGSDRETCGSIDAFHQYPAKSGHKQQDSGL